MARKVTPRDLALRDRWAMWLDRFFSQPRTVSNARLNNAMHSMGWRGDYRNAIKLYRAGKRTPTPSAAFALGEALRFLGERDANGLIALNAAGYFGNAVELLIRLGMTKNGAWPALALHFVFAHRLTEASDEEWFFHFEDAADELACAAVEEIAKVDLASLFRSCNGGKRLPSWARGAIMVADTEFEDAWEERVSESWLSLRPFARDLFEKCGGQKRKPRPLSLVDAMPYLPAGIEQVRPKHPERS